MSVKIWDLKEIVGSLTVKHKEIEKIFLFGSRGYGTNSRRSDIDLLIYVPEGISTRDITDWIHEDYPPVDVFITTDMKIGTSAINGSCVRAKDSSLDKKLDAIELWNKASGLSVTFNRWQQTTDSRTEFRMTAITLPDIPTNPNEIMKNYYEALRGSQLPTYFLGNDWKSIGESIVNIIKKAFVIPTKYSKRARNFKFNEIKMQDEYDFQNIIHLVLRPIFNTIEPENCAIILDGNSKKADFGIDRNKIIIEAKYIKDTSSKDAIIKTIEGLENFYKDNPNVRLLIFLILYEENVTLDKVILEGRFMRKYENPPIFVTFIKNTYSILCD